MGTEFEKSKPNGEDEQPITVARRIPDSVKAIEMIVSSDIALALKASKARAKKRSLAE